jgi:hypothetical protein
VISRVNQWLDRKSWGIQRRTVVSLLSNPVMLPARPLLPHKMLPLHSEPAPVVVSSCVIGIGLNNARQ